MPKGVGQKRPLLEVDPKGFARVQGDKPKGRLLAELYQNSKDEDGTKNIVIKFEYKGRGLSYFSVEDDSPAGFDDLSHAYTLFAPSYKLDHPEKSGWMNLGEKMVVVGTRWCRISTTKGEVFFDMKDQTREEFPRRKRDAGTLVEGEIATSHDEYAEAVAFLNMLLRGSKNVTINGDPLPERKLQASFQCALPTRILGADGLASSTVRKTTVCVWEKKEGEEVHIYELGIPVVAFAPQDNMKWHIDVGQKVPLNKDRDNVTPAFKSLLLVHVLNDAYELVTKDDVTANWVIEAASQPQATKDATEHVLDEAYGEKRVAASVTDLEANNKAVGNGYTVIPSRGMTPGMRANAKSFGLLPVSHDLFATPAPFSNDPNAPPVEEIDPSEWTRGMKNVVEFSRFLGEHLLQKLITVYIVKSLGNGCAAAYGGGTLYFSVSGLGRKWFDIITPEVEELIIHEFGHEWAKNHLSEEYHDALCKLAVRYKKLALQRPDSLKAYLGEIPR